MITFGYNSRFSAPLRALLFAALGVLLIVAKTDAMELVVKIVAAFILAAGIVSVFVGFRQKKDGTTPLSFFNGLVNVVIAGLLFMFAPFVAKFVSYLLGFVLFGFGLFQLIALVSANRVMRMGAGSFVLPAVVFIAGLFLIMRPAFIGEAIGVIAGVALIIYGASELLSSWKMKKAIDEYEIKFPSEKPAPKAEEDIHQVKDVEYEKVDEQ